MPHPAVNRVHDARGRPVDPPRVGDQLLRRRRTTAASSWGQHLYQAQSAWRPAVAGAFSWPFHLATDTVVNLAGERLATAAIAVRKSCSVRPSAELGLSGGRVWSRSEVSDVLRTLRTLPPQGPRATPACACLRSGLAMWIPPNKPIAYSPRSDRHEWSMAVRNRQTPIREPSELTQDSISFTVLELGSFLADALNGTTAS